jgi:hypothetical protein
LNSISHQPAGLELELSNGATTALVCALVAAGSELARTDWERRFVCWIGEHDQEVIGLGVVGFDVLDIAWSASELPAQKAFVLLVAAHAGTPAITERLGYQDTDIARWLEAFARLIAAVDAPREGEADWAFSFGEPDGSRCPTHRVYQHRAGCPLCNADG